MGKFGKKVVAALGSGGLTTGALWVVATFGLDLTSPFGLLVTSAVTTAATWVAAHWVASSGPAPAP